MSKELSLTVLVYEDECGLWLKIPQADLQCCTDEFDAGLAFLEEELDVKLDQARKWGEEVPERRVWTVRRVGKEEYGPTEVDIQRERYEQELRGRGLTRR
jgi:hypothetical protein